MEYKSYKNNHKLYNKRKLISRINQMNKTE